MTDTPPSTPPGDRVAKVLSRAGIASRRDAERMIAEGRVRVNGKVITSPALNIAPSDRVSVDGTLVGDPEPPRLWLYHKPAGVVTTARDEKGRPTVFDALPEDMPRVMSIGRLDINSEGLLILTNDGEVKRKLELPATGWLRRYRVRINGSVSEANLDRLRKGIEVEGVRYQPMIVTFDRQQGANAWLTVSLREGKNREIRRAMEGIGVTVNRLIRVSYGPFQLGSLKAGEVEELKSRVVRDQLGLDERAKPQRRRASSASGGPVATSAKSLPATRPVKSAGNKPRQAATWQDDDQPAKPRPRSAGMKTFRSGGDKTPDRAGPEPSRPRSAGMKSAKAHGTSRPASYAGKAPASHSGRPPKRGK